jgi:hypothetical protein
VKRLSSLGLLEFTKSNGWMCVRKSICYEDIQKE